VLIGGFDSLAHRRIESVAAVCLMAGWVLFVGVIRPPSVSIPVSIQENISRVRDSLD
jgi:hypothetical protein